MTGVGPFTSKTTGLVTPWIVRSPAILNLPLPAGSTEVDLNVNVGYFATSKKSGLFRWASRFGSRVLIEEASIVASKTAVE